MPRRTRRQLVGKDEAFMQYVRERRIAVLAASLHSQWIKRKESR